MHFNVYMSIWSICLYGQTFHTKKYENVKNRVCGEGTVLPASSIFQFIFFDSVEVVLRINEQKGNAKNFPGLTNVIELLMLKEFSIATFPRFDTFDSSV